MPIEFALEKYPIHVKVKSDLDCEVRPLIQEDRDRIKELYLSVPEHERLFVKQRMNDGSLFHEWCDNIDYENNLPLLVLHNGKVIAEGTLHQRQGGWKSHIGIVSILTHPDFRGLGLSRIVINELVDVARHAGLHRLEAEFTGDRTIALHAFAMAGFTELVRLPGYVKDFDAKFHDYVMMGMKLKTREEYAGVG